MHTYVPSKSFDQLLDTSLKNVIFLKTFDPEFFYLEVWFTDQMSEVLQVENKININLTMN